MALSLRYAADYQDDTAGYRGGPRRELSIPAVCAAEPGIATYLDLPLIGGKAAPRLS
jgi:hypothetical protein